MKNILIVLFSLTVLGGVTACGPKAFVKGSYDDVERENLLNDQWSETDMQNVVKDLVASMMKHPAIRRAPRPPLVMATRLQNKTSEHIDTQNILDMLRVELMNSGEIQFVDKAAREDIAEEYEYQNSGMVSETTRKGPGGQMGADFIINGRLDSIVQQAGADKTVYYKITMNLTNLKTGVIVWSNYKQIRKKFRERTVGL
jgi:uncharacterized protein (TIGR02722 family)